MVSMVRASSEIHSHTRFRGVARIFKGGGVDFLLTRAKQGARVAYVRLCVFLELESLVVSGVKPW